MIGLYWIVFSIIGIFIPIIGKVWFHKTITIKEVAAIGIFNAIILSIVISLGSYSSTWDTEVHNGYVVEKYSKKVSCEHSYQCNCATVSCGKDCTTRVCQTCYRHSYDIDYVVGTSVGILKIAREDDMGKRVPKRWENVAINEAASLEYSFKNYIKAAPDSLFNDRHLRKSEVEVVKYPQVYDYYRINRVINTSSARIDTKAINSKLNDILRTLGSEKHINIVVYFWEHENDNYDRIVEAKWLGGKQNDLIVMIKTKPDASIERVYSFGFSVDSSVYYRVNRMVKDLEVVETETLVEALVEASSSFKRQDMETYAYLEDSIEPPLWVVIFSALLSIIGTMIASYFAHKEDWF